MEAIYILTSSTDCLVMIISYKQLAQVNNARDSEKHKITFSGFHLRMNSQKIIQKLMDFAAEDSQPKYYDISKKDRSLIRLLFMMSIVFFATNIPMAVARIMQAFGHTDNKVFRDFVVVANVMEIFFASSNFYLYCFCNHQFRRNVSEIFYFILVLLAMSNSCHDTSSHKDA